MNTIEPLRSTTGFNVWHAMTHSFRDQGSFGFSLGFGAMALLIYVMSLIVLGLIFGLLAGGAIAAFGSGMAVGDLGGIGAGTYIGIGIGYIVFLLAYFFVMAIIDAGMHRRMLGQQDGGFTFRIGEDEKNVFLSLLGVYGIYIVISLIGFGLQMLAGASLMSSLGNGEGTTLSKIVAFIVFVVQLIYLVRICPATALSVHTKRPVVLGAFKVSQYRSWWIFLVYLLLAILFYAVLFGIILLTVGPSVFMGMGAAGLSGGMGGLLSIAILILLMLFLPMMIGVGSYVVKQWGGMEPPQADVFS